VHASGSAATTASHLDLFEQPSESLGILLGCWGRTQACIVVRA